MFLQKQRINECCCGLKVETGSFVIGILEFFGCISQACILAFPIDNDYYRGNYYGGQLSSTIIAFIISGFLLWGIHSRQKIFLLPWLVVKIVSFIILVILVCMVFAVSIIYGEIVLLYINMVLLICAAFLHYFMRCVLSFYYELQEEENQICVKA